MPAPWEKYQKPNEGPWGKYGAQPAPAREYDDFGMMSDDPMDVSPYIKAMAGQAVAENTLASGVGAADAATAGWRGIAAAVPGGKTPIEAFEQSAGQWSYTPESEAGQRLQGGLDYVGQKLDSAADYVGEVTGAPTDTVGATAVKTGLLALPMMLGWRRGGGRAPVPKTKELAKTAKESYKAADESGVAVRREPYADFANRVLERVSNEGIDKGLHKKSMRALQRIMDDEGQHITLKGLQRIRQNINDAIGAAKDKSDRRMGIIMRNEFDEFMKGLKDSDLLTGDRAGIDAFFRGNELYARKAKATEIEGLVEKAKNSAPSFSASGYENALRTKMKQLADNDSRMRRFSPDEQKQIQKAARGTVPGRIMRNVGRFMPSSPVSAVATGGVGYMMGGPVGAAVLGGAGTLGRMGAMVSRQNQVNALLELIRRGEKVDPRDKQRALATALLANETQ